MFGRPLHDPSQVGDNVFVQNQAVPHPNKWDRSGTVIEYKDNDQYIVKLDGTGRLTLRNRRFLKLYTLPSTTLPSALLPLSWQSTPTVPLRRNWAGKSPFSDVENNAVRLPKILQSSPKNLLHSEEQQSSPHIASRT